MTRRYYMIAIGLTVLALAVGMVAYPMLPDAIPSHWDLQNQVNGYSPKWHLLVLGPGAMAGIIIIFSLLPWLSPKHFEVDSSRSTYLRMMIIMVTLLAYVYGAVLWTGLGHALDVGRAIVGGVCLLIASLGNFMGKLRRNFYIGIRTPWALASERVWNATHRLAAKTFVAGGVVGLVFTLAGWTGWPVLVSMSAGALAPVVYSLVFYKQLERHGEV